MTLTVDINFDEIPLYVRQGIGKAAFEMIMRHKDEIRREMGCKDSDMDSESSESV